MGIFWIFLLLVILLTLVLVLLARRDAKYFESKGIYYLGDGMLRLIYVTYKGLTFNENVQSQYNELQINNVKMAGTKEFGTTALFITDLDLIKQILVKDFDHFINRRTFTIPKSDILMNKMLISVKDEQWKALRSKMSPTFTTGKIKRMFNIFDESGKKLVKFVEQQMKETGQMDLTDGYSKFTMDVIASAACGINSQAFDQVEPSVFEQMGKKMQFQFGGLQLFKLLMMVVAPLLTDAVGFSFFGKDVYNFFTTAIKSSINHRIKSGEKRDDFIQLMVEAREGLLKTEEGELENFEKEAEIKTTGDSNVAKVNNAELLDDDGIVSNCVLFILAGFDTTQTLLIFAAYSLALHQDVQDKLRAEIETVLNESDGKFTYEGINKMVYLDMVLNETLRVYPPAAATDRGCTQDYKIPGTNFTLKKGQAVVIPILGIHHDEKYYPEPEKFDPERFSPENKAKLNPYAFLPFGHGPRNCIGMRFALTEIKVAIANLVHNFTIEPSEKTLIPMKFANVGSLKPKGGMWLALNKRH